MAKNSLVLPPVVLPLPAGLMKALGLLAAHRDIAFALGIVLMMAILVVPMPPLALDFGLALSFTFAVLILLVPLWIERPLEFSVFPTVLLLATMIRLALNVVSTRLILTHGHEGAHAAGGVIADAEARRRRQELQEARSCRRRAASWGRWTVPASS
jgi:flagellar biosynthesis component FlhA